MRIKSCLGCPLQGLGVSRSPDLTIDNGVAEAPGAPFGRLWREITKAMARIDTPGRRPGQRSLHMGSTFTISLNPATNALIVQAQAGCKAFPLIFQEFRVKVTMASDATSSFHLIA
ncbi:MAG: hypothetical protein R3F54_12100 [Alphaproteobacteria bacterium]